MKEENKKTYLLEPLFEHFNENHYLKPMGYQHIINSLANEHLKGTNQGIGVVLAGKYVWVLVSMTYQIIKPITKVKAYKGKTWYSGRKGPFFRREYCLYDEDEIIVKAASYSILMDIADRSIYREKQLLFNEYTENKEYLVNCEPRLKESFNFEIVNKERKVLNSYLDPIGHVNNLRYPEFIYDVFTKGEIDNINQITKFELYFQKELQIDETFIIKKVIDSNRKIFEIFNTAKKEKAFSLILHY